MNLKLLIILFLPLVSYGQSKNLSSIINDKIDSYLNNPVNSILIYVERDNNKVLNEGYGWRDKESEKVSETDQFRIASATKTFVATIILQMIEERKLTINNTAHEYLEHIDYLDFDNLHWHNGKPLANKITIEQLLSHRSGLADIFTDRKEEFFELLLQNPQLQYTPQDIVKLYYQFGLNMVAHFKPGKGWSYSDMNYVLLGLIIESIDKKSLAESIRNRILNHLKMENTFFEFYESPTKNDNRIHQYIGDIDMTEINTSFDWAGGGLVSNNIDLAKFINALFDFNLIDESSLNKMINVQFTKEQENRYGLGIYESKYNGDIYYGHYGFYGTYIGFCPEKRIVLSYSISQVETNFNAYSFINDVLKLTE